MVVAAISTSSITDTIHLTIARGYTTDPAYSALYNALQAGDISKLHKDSDAEIVSNAKQ
jgi:hypothetical protein